MKLTNQQWTRVIVLAAFMAMAGIIAYQCDRIDGLKTAPEVKAKEDRIKAIDGEIKDNTDKAINTLEKAVKVSENHVKENKSEQDAYKKYINREKVVDTVYENNAKFLENYK